MNDREVKINSLEYWNHRFASDWETEGGIAQSHYFANLAFESLPQWLIHKIRKSGRSLVDWGCATGDGTAFLASSLSGQDTVGVDFSDHAIELARKRYPQIAFRAENWLDGKTDQVCTYDFVFSSNTLEHLEQYEEGITELARRAKLALILLLPYREQNLHPEHVVRFDPEVIESRIDESFQLVWAKVIDCRDIPGSKWAGEQICLVYAKSEWLNQIKLSLADHVIATEDVDRLRNDLDESREITRSALESLASETEKYRKSNISLCQQFDQTKKEFDQIKKEKQCLANLAAHKEEAFEREQKRSSALESSIAELQHEVTEKERELEDKSRELSRVCADLDWDKKEVVRLAAQLTQQKKRYQEILDSKSWRWTAPVRFTGMFLKSPSYALSILPNYLYARSPARVRSWALRLKYGSSHSVQGSHPDEMSWEEFAERILSKRDRYKGIFIQEPTIPFKVDLYQRPQHLSVALGRKGYLVIYRTFADGINGVQMLAENVWVTPRPEVESIHGAVHSFYSTAYATQLAQIECAKKRAKAIIFEYIDHIDPKISGEPKNIERLISLRDAAFSGRFDYVVCSAKGLYDEMAEHLGDERLLLVPNGVDTAHYRKVSHAKVILPENLLAFRKTYSNIVGFFGAIAPWLWYEVIEKLCHQHPDIGFLFIGPDYYGGVERLPKSNNFLHIGPVNYQSLPAYASLFDIAFLPFEPGDIARTTSPLKLFEYFALELPVVCTADMTECVKYPEVLSGNSEITLGHALDKAIALKSEEGYKKKLAKLADQNDWRIRADEFAKIFKV